jgi:hypothetical protein
MGLFNDIDPIFFYHKSVKPLLAMGFNGVVTPSGELETNLFAKCQSFYQVKILTKKFLVKFFYNLS